MQHLDNFISSDAEQDEHSLNGLGSEDVAFVVDACVTFGKIMSHDYFLSASCRFGTVVPLQDIF